MSIFDPNQTCEIVLKQDLSFELLHNSLYIFFIKDVKKALKF